MSGQHAACSTGCTIWLLCPQHIHPHTHTYWCLSVIVLWKDRDLLYQEKILTELAGRLSACMTNFIFGKGGQSFLNEHYFFPSPLYLCNSLLQTHIHNTDHSPLACCNSCSWPLRSRFPAPDVIDPPPGVLQGEIYTDTQSDTDTCTCLCTHTHTHRLTHTVL